MARLHKLSALLALALAALTPLAADRLAAQVYVANANADSVLVFDPAVGGPQAPLQQITATPGFMDLPSSVAVDVARNELFVAGRGPDAGAVEASAAVRRRCACPVRRPTGRRR